MLQSDQTKGDVESREKVYQRELKELRAKLNEVNHERHVQKESVLQAERSNKTIRLELEEKENIVRQLQDEVPSIIISSSLHLHDLNYLC